MSSTWAVAAVTAALRNLLQSQVPARDPVLSDLSVTTRTPDVARKTVSGASLNVFLYGTAVSAAWRNQDPPSARPGEAATPALALDLHYLVTAYGRDDADQDAVGHRALAGAMAVLHDHPLLDPSELLLGGDLGGNGLAGQPERLRITALPLSTDELSKLWTAFQTNLRVSAAYEVTVVLIDSVDPGSAALPVLARGAQDQGAQTVLGAAATLAALTPPAPQPAAVQGQLVTVSGSNLSPVDTVLRFTSLWQPAPPAALAPVELAPVAGTVPGQLALTLPDLAADPTAWGSWVPGFYTVAAVTRTAGLPAMVSNAVALALAPAITLSPHAPATVSAGGTLTLTCSPRIGDGQHVSILCGDLPVQAASLSNPAPADPNHDSTPTTLTFTLPAMAAGSYPVRLRVDGVDSMPVTFTGPVPAFDPAQQVVVT